jgi:hypothetical protein
MNIEEICEHCESIRNANKNLSERIKKLEDVVWENNLLKENLTNSALRIVKLEKEVKLKNRIARIIKGNEMLKIIEEYHTPDGIFIKVE